MRQRAERSSGTLSRSRPLLRFPRGASILSWGGKSMSWIYYPDNCPFTGLKDARLDQVSGLLLARGLPIENDPIWAYLKDSDCGTWRIYKRRDELNAYWESRSALSEEDRAKLAEQERKEAEAKKQSRKEKFKNGLSIEERDRSFKNIFEELKLQPTDRELIRNRLAIITSDRAEQDRLIDPLGLKSVDDRQRLKNPVSDKLAGIKTDGKTLLVSRGLLVPVRDYRGRILGCQQRPYDKSRGKTSWLAGEKKRGDDRPASNLRSGELPISYHRTLKPENKTFDKRTIILTESNDYKPFIVAQQLGCDAIGAAGGMFSQSRELLQEYLNYSKPEQVVFAPDSNGTTNVEVINRDRATLELLTELGYPVLVLWYGQKYDNEDPDEVSRDTLVKAKLLTIEQYSQICQPAIDALEAIKEIEKELTVGQTEKYFNKPQVKKQNFSEQYKRKYLQAKQLEYRRHKVLISLDYKPDVKVNSRYLPDILSYINLESDRGEIVLLKGEKGSGKTRQIREIRDEALRLGMTVLLLVPRRGLGREIAAKMGGSFLDEDGKHETTIERKTWELIEIGKERDLDGNERIKYERRETIETVTQPTSDPKQATVLALCPDSLPKLKCRDWNKTVLIYDEIETTLDHEMFSKTLLGKRGRVLGEQEWIINKVTSHGGTVILSDADLSNTSADFAKELSDDKTQITTIVNKASSPNPFEVKLYRGRKHKGRVIDALYEAISQDKKIVIASDSQAQLRAIEAELKKRHPDKAAGIKIVDSEFSETREGKDFIRGINDEVKKTKIWCLAYSPTIYIGVSIEDEPSEDKLFDCVFGLFTGVLTPSQIRQSLIRYRSPVPRIVWVENVGKIEGELTSTDPNEIAQQLADYNMQSVWDMTKTRLANKLNREPNLMEIHRAIGEMIDPETNTCKDPHLELYAKRKARTNYEKKNLALLLKLELIREGHRVVDFSDRAKIKSDNLEALNDRKEELEDEKFESIANSPTITPDEAKQLENKPGITKQEKATLAKHNIEQSLPGVEITSSFTKKALADRKRWLNSVRLYWRYKNPEASDCYDFETWERTYNSIQYFWDKESDRILESVLHLPDVKTFSPKIRLLQDLKLFDYIDLDDLNKEYRGSDAEAKNILKIALKNKKRLERILGIRVTKRTAPLKLIKSILEKISILMKRKKYGKESNSDNYYLIDSQALNDPDRLAVLQALDLKYDRWRAKKTEQGWLKNDGKNDTVQTFARPNLKGSSLPAVNVYNHPARSDDPSSPDISIVSSDENCQNETECITEQLYNDLPVAEGCKTSIEEANPEVKVTNMLREESKITPMVESTNSKYDSPEEIKILSEFLALCDGPENLADIKALEPCTRERLNRAAKLLPIAQRKKLREWAIELNNQQQPQQQEEATAATAAAESAESEPESEPEPIEYDPPEIFTRNDFIYLGDNIKRICRGETDLLEFLEQWSSEVFKRVWEVMAEFESQQKIDEMRNFLANNLQERADFLLARST